MNDQAHHVLRRTSDGKLMFMCPGCDEYHGVQVGDGPGPRWSWNNDMVRPTFGPSILVSWEWGTARTPKRCHSFVVLGRIQYLDDCTHKLAGQTVDLPPARPFDI